MINCVETIIVAPTFLALSDILDEKKTLVTCSEKIEFESWRENPNLYELVREIISSSLRVLDNSIQLLIGQCILAFRRRAADAENEVFDYVEKKYGDYVEA